MANLDHIAFVNPFRYRGYYYDQELKLYYLQSRYYDPEVGRFINADSAKYLEPSEFGGLNLYAYCGNNPVMRVDPNGNAWWDVFFKVIGWMALAVASVALTVVTFGGGSVFAIGLASIAFSTALGGVIGGYANEMSGGSFMSGWIGGAFNGFVQSLSAIAFPGIGRFIGAFAGGFTGTALTQAIDNFLPNGKKRGMGEIFLNSLFAGIASVAFSAFSKLIKYSVDYSVDNAVEIGGKAITEGFGKALAGFFNINFDIFAAFFGRELYV